MRNACERIAPVSRRLAPGSGRFGVGSGRLESRREPSAPSFGRLGSGCEPSAPRCGRLNSRYEPSAPRCGRLGSRREPSAPRSRGRRFVSQLSGSGFRRSGSRGQPSGGAAECHPERSEGSGEGISAQALPAHVRLRRTSDRWSRSRDRSRSGGRSTAPRGAFGLFEGAPCREPAAGRRSRRSGRPRGRLFFGLARLEEQIDPFEDLASALRRQCADPLHQVVFVYREELRNDHDTALGKVCLPFL